MYMMYLVRPSWSHDGSYSTLAVMQLQDNHSNDTHTQQINIEILANHLARLTKMDGHTGTQILFNEVKNKKKLKFNKMAIWGWQTPQLHRSEQAPLK